jgi:hypothetical protein
MLRGPKKSSDCQQLCQRLQQAGGRHHDTEWQRYLRAADIRRERRQADARSCVCACVIQVAARLVVCANNLQLQ